MILHSDNLSAKFLQVEKNGEHKILHYDILVMTS
jgi:hypothetical protein